MFAEYEIRVHDHFYHLGSTENLRNTMTEALKGFMLARLPQHQNGYTVCGMVDRRGRIYPIGSDTKVISAIFEIITRQVVVAYANNVGLGVKEATKQNHYPAWRQGVPYFASKVSFFKIGSKR